MILVKKKKKKKQTKTKQQLVWSDMTIYFWLTWLISISGRVI